MVLVMQHKSVIYYDKPYYLGFSILDISKFIMYDYFYNVLRQYFGHYENLQLLYSDTDSFILKVKSHNLINDLINLKPTMDFSNLPNNHTLFDKSNQSKLFHFKEEFGMLPILRLVSLGSKVYSLETVCCHEHDSHSDEFCTTSLISKKDGCNFISDEKLILKGVSKIAKRTLSFDDYYDCLTNQISKRVTDHRIQSKKQQISTTFVRKIALASFCDKRFIMDCGIHSRPYSENKISKCDASECS